MHLPPTEHLPDVAGHPPKTPPVTPVNDVRFEEEIDFGQYVRPLRRHWILIAVACLLGAAAGFAVSARRPIRYEASTAVLVQQASSGEAFATARALLRNYTLAAETVKEVGLASEPYRMTAQSFVNDALAVEESGGTHLLNVKVRLADPVLAAKASHLLSMKAVQLNRQVATEGNRAVRDQLKVLLDDATRRLDSAEQELLAARTQARLEVAKKDTELMLDARAESQQIAARIASEKGRLVAAEEELTHHEPLLGAPRQPSAEEALRQADAAQRRTEEVLRQGEQRQPDTVLRQPEALLQSGTSGTRRNRDAATRRGSGASRGPDTPQSAQAVQGNPERSTFRRFDTAELDALPDLSNPFVNPVYQTLQFQIAMSRARIAGLERERQQIEAAGRGGVITQLYRSELTTDRLENDYELAKQVYSELAVRFEQSRVDSIGNMVQLQIVDPATPPDRPMPRKRVESSLLGLAGGFFLAALVAIFVMPRAPEDAPDRARRHS